MSKILPFKKIRFLRKKKTVLAFITMPDGTKLDLSLDAAQRQVLSPTTSQDEKSTFDNLFEPLPRAGDDV